MTLVQVLKSVRFPKLQIFVEIFAKIYRAHYGAAMLVYHFGTPTWRPDNSVNICALLRLIGRPIICTEQTSMYIRTFPDTLTSE